MSQRIIIRVCKKGAIYLPRKIMRDMGISEGDYLLVRIKGNKLIMEVIPDPFLLAVKTKKWAKTTVEEFERESEIEQEQTLESNS
ncbi:MAG: AbrB/MazE/SpoVT family DNA-binding domain-containing protein [Thermoprotei archaeon]|nr:MAG: AbrB/MazE/SpoVT family DNA-binding domain-containing protein [Thermoprotei archaeon]